MKRKIIELGNNCMVMSLPIKWIKKNQLKKGFELSVNETKNNLIISPSESVKKPKTISIEIKKTRESGVRTNLVNLYRTGYDKIIITYDGGKKDLEEVVSKYLLGFEIFTKSKNTYSCETISEPSLENFKIILDKSFFVLKEILKNMGSESIVSEVNNLQKYDNFLKRVLAKKTSLESTDLPMWQFLSNITQTAIQCKHLEEYLLNDILPNIKVGVSKKKDVVQKSLHLQSKGNIGFFENKNLSQAQKKHFQYLLEMFEGLHKGYLQKDTELLIKLHSMDQKIGYIQRKKILSEKDSVVSYYILSIARLIYLASSPLIAVIQAENVTDPV